MIADCQGRDHTAGKTFKPTYVASMSNLRVYIYKNEGYMLTAFCDIVFVITAVFGSMAGLFSASPVLWSGSGTTTYPNVSKVEDARNPRRPRVRL
jgi:hypothetical protein